MKRMYGALQISFLKTQKINDIERAKKQLTHYLNFNNETNRKQKV